jgi:serine protease AprX
MQRNQVEDLLFGGRMARRYTQDTPILPDVWIAYAAEPGESKRLLLTPWQGQGKYHTTPGPLSLVVRHRLKAERQRVAAPPKRRTVRRGAPAQSDIFVHVAYNISTVLTELTFAELVRVVLPLSAWWQRRVIDAGYQKYISMLPELQGDEKFLASLDEPSVALPRRKPPPPKKGRGSRGSATAAGPASPYEVPPEVLWMIHVAGTIALAERAARSGSELPDDWPPPRGDNGGPSADRLAHLGEVVGAVSELLEGIDTTTTSVSTKDDDDPTATTNEVRIYSINLDRSAQVTLRDSRVSVKADSAARLFSLSCRDLSWAVIDSGVDARHPAFRRRDPAGKACPAPFDDQQNQTRITATYDLTLIHYLLNSDDAPEDPVDPGLKGRLAVIRKRVEAGKMAGATAEDQVFLAQYQRLKRSLLKGQTVDWKLLLPFITVPQTDLKSYRPPTNEHGTHVAGIIGADWRTTDTEDHVYPEPDADMQGIAPDINLYDIRVLDDKGRGDEFNVIAAMQFLRYLKAQRDYMAFHGVNVSLSIRQDVANYACGRTPVCDECERLVGSGIVVVAAAGNDGYKQFRLAKDEVLESFHSISITDPGNAEGVITVGSTHRLMPHTYGVSYFSSRGPTGDGRAKPDLVAPGEKITGPAPDGALVTLDGTSMAAPHVSGAVALLIARHRELAGQPHEIKRILCKTATDLGRERYFQGAGMVDILRALQSV